MKSDVHRVHGFSMWFPGVNLVLETPRRNPGAWGHPSILERGFNRFRIEPIDFGERWSYKRNTAACQKSDANEPERQDKYLYWFRTCFSYLAHFSFSNVILRMWRIFDDAQWHKIFDRRTFWKAIFIFTFILFLFK